MFLINGSAFEIANSKEFDNEILMNLRIKDVGVSPKFSEAPFTNTHKLQFQHRKVFISHVMYGMKLLIHSQPSSEVCEGINNLITHYTMDVIITYACWDKS